MAKNLKDFYGFLANDESALKELEAKAKESGLEEDELLEAVIIPYAKEHGYEFAIEEIRAFDSEGEISESELEAVSGGKKCICAVIGAVKGCGCFMVGGSSTSTLGCFGAGV